MLDGTLVASVPRLSEPLAGTPAASDHPAAAKSTRLAVIGPLASS
jgi:hypothetical protein